MYKRQAHASGFWGQEGSGYGLVESLGGTWWVPGGAGSAQSIDLVFKGNWQYGTGLHAGMQVDLHGMPYYELSPGGSPFSAGGTRLSLNPLHSYRYEISGILNCLAYDNGGFSSGHHCIAFDAKGIFSYPAGTIGAAEPVIIHQNFSYCSTPRGGGWKTTMNGANPEPSTGVPISTSSVFSFIIAQGGADPHGDYPGATPPGVIPWGWGTAPSGTTPDQNVVKFIIRENNTDPAYPNFSSAVIKINLVEVGMFWDGTMPIP